MKRRKFVQSGFVAASSLPFVSAGIIGTTPNVKADKFKMKFAPHTGMFKNLAGEDPIDQIKFMSDQGFTAFEDNWLKRREPGMQTRIGDTLANLDMEMGVFVGGRVDGEKPSLVTGDESFREAFIADIKSSIETSKRVNARWMTVILGSADPRVEMGYQTVNVIEVLKRASGLLEPHNLAMVLEPLNFYNHPGLFLTKISQAYKICKAVNSPTCKILFDIYHQQIQEGNLIPNMERSWDEIGYFQIGDNPGRNEPTTGEINYKKIFSYIHDKGYSGILGMEHGNSIQGTEGERALISAYREVDVE